MRRLIATVVVVALALIGCGDTANNSSNATGPNAAEQAVTKMTQGTVTVIDVRTPEEFAEGHVAGALNINVEGADFGSRIADLDRTGAYVVYCRSGRRSAIAATAMRGAGFTDVLDAGAFDDLTAAGATTR